MKKFLYIATYMTYPSLLSAIFSLMPCIESSRLNVGYGFIALAYGLTIYGFYHFVKKRPFNQWLLFIGFVAVPLLPYLYEYNNPSWFQYIDTLLAIFYYTIPYIIASIIIAITISLKNIKRPK